MTIQTLLTVGVTINCLWQFSYFPWKYWWGLKLNFLRLYKLSFAYKMLNDNWKIYGSCSFGSLRYHTTVHPRMLFNGKSLSTPTFFVFWRPLSLVTRSPRRLVRIRFSRWRLYNIILSFILLIAKNGYMPWEMKIQSYNIISWGHRVIDHLIGDCHEICAGPTHTVRMYPMRGSMPCTIRDLKSIVSMAGGH